MSLDILYILGSGTPASPPPDTSGKGDFIPVPSVTPISGVALRYAELNPVRAGLVGLRSSGDGPALPHNAAPQQIR
ncbi:MAG: hypothetical protein ACRD2U_03125, partial [Terriglobales bacterium]